MSKQRILIIASYYGLVAAAAVLSLLIHGSIPVPAWVQAVVAAAGVPLDQGISEIIDLLKPAVAPPPAAPKA